MKLWFHCLLTVAVCCSLNTAAVSQSFRPGKDVKPWFNEAQLSLQSAKPCQGAWTDNQLNDWFYSQRQSVLWLSEIWTQKNKTARHWRELLSGYFYDGLQFHFEFGAGDLYTTLPVLWVDYSGDGRCDFIGRGFGAGNKHFDDYFLFIHGPTGFKLVAHTGLPGREVEDHGEKPQAILPVYIRGEAIPLLVSQQDISLYDGTEARHSSSIYESPSIEMAEGDRSRTALRWNPKRNSFEIYDSINAPKVIEVINRFLARHPERFKDPQVKFLDQEDNYYKQLKNEDPGVWACRIQRCNPPG